MLCFSPNRMIGSDQIRKFALHYGQIWVFCPLLQRTLFRCGLFRWISANLSFAAMFFSEWRDFLLGILPNKPYFLNNFLTGLSWTWIFNLLRPVESEMYRLLFKNISLSLAQSDLGVNLTGNPHLERLVPVLNILNLWIIFFTVQKVKTFWKRPYKPSHSHGQ